MGHIEAFRTVFAEARRRVREIGESGRVHLASRLASALEEVGEVSKDIGEEGGPASVRVISGMTARLRLALSSGSDEALAVAVCACRDDVRAAKGCPSVREAPATPSALVETPASWGWGDADDGAEIPAPTRKQVLTLASAPDLTLEDARILASLGAGEVSADLTPEQKAARDAAGVLLYEEAVEEAAQVIGLLHDAMREMANKGPIRAVRNLDLALGEMKGDSAQALTEIRSRIARDMSSRSRTLSMHKPKPPAFGPTETPARIDMIEMLIGPIDAVIDLRAAYEVDMVAMADGFRAVAEAARHLVRIAETDSAVAARGIDGLRGFVLAARGEGTKRSAVRLPQEPAVQEPAADEDEDDEPQDAIEEPSPAGRMMSVIDRDRGVAEAKRFSSEYARWREPLKLVAKHGLPLRGAVSVEAIADTLDREFPWMESANRHVRVSMQLRSKGEHSWFWMPPLLLDGPAGTGKTTWVQRLAELAGVPHALMACAGLNNAFGFSGSQRAYRSAEPGFPFRKMCELRTANPVLLLDEIDKTGSSDHNGRLHDAILTALEPATWTAVPDEFLQLPIDMSAVVWVMTANDASRLPEPLRSRITVVRVREPEVEHARALVPKMSKGVAALHKIPGEVMPPLNDERVQVLLDEFEGHRSLRLLRKGVESAMADLVAGPSEGRKSPDDCQALPAGHCHARRTAVHEAGHAVAALARGIEILKATCRPDDGGLSYGHVMMKSPEGNPSADLLKARLVMALGGHVAERLVFGPGAVTTGASQDIEVASETARRMVRLGMSSLGLTLSSAAKDADGRCEKEAQRLLREAADECERILAANLGTVQSMAAEMQAKGTLVRGEVAAYAAGIRRAPADPTLWGWLRTEGARRFEALRRTLRAA